MAWVENSDELESSTQNVCSGNGILYDQRKTAICPLKIDFDRLKNKLRRHMTIVLCCHFVPDEVENSDEVEHHTHYVCSGNSACHDHRCSTIFSLERLILAS